MVKKMVSCLLVVVLLLSLMLQTNAANSETKRKGIDVSSHQGYIDWDVTKNHIDFAIIRVGYGQDYENQDDTQWFRNVEACTRLGIPFGVYIYSYATSERAIAGEVRHVLRLLKGYSPSLPVYLDLEDSGIVKSCTPAQILNQVTIFCDMIQEAGYTPGVYANANWWDKYLTSSKYNQWERWVAQYGSDLHDSRPYTMWQYSNTGSVPGIQGNVDMNYWYGEATNMGCAHSYFYYTIQEDNCTKGGVRHYYCTKCQNKFSENVRDCISSRFYDAPSKSHWAHSGIDYAVDAGWFRGVSNTRFDPNGVMTRAMAVTVLWRWADCPEPNSSCNFKDVDKKAWYGEAVAWAQENNIVNGVGDGLFAPTAMVTREQFAVMVYRLYSRNWSEEPKYTLGDFTDKYAVSEYAVTAMAWTTQCSLIKGCEKDGTVLLLPRNGVTRAQVATILLRLLG